MLTFFPDDLEANSCFPTGTSTEEKLRHNCRFWDKYLSHQSAIIGASASKEALAVDGLSPQDFRCREKIVAFIGVPMDIGVGYRHGTRFGPRAIREVSSQFGSGVETGFDLRETGQIIVDLGDIEIHSYVLDSDLFKDDVLRDVWLAYLADGEVPPAWIGNIQRIENTLKWVLGTPVQPAFSYGEGNNPHILLPEQCEILRGNVFPVIIGGDHSITYPAMKAVQAAYSRRPDDLGIVYFDAHPDYLTRRSGLKTTHASQARRVADQIGAQNVMQVGLRYIEKEELVGMMDEGVKFWTMQNLQHISPAGLADQICDYANQRGIEHLYISVDIDVLDAAVVPGTGVPEPGGMQTRWLVDALQELGTRLQKDGRVNVEAFDVVEIAPDWDIAHITALAAVKIILEGVGTLYPALHQERVRAIREDTGD